MMKLEEKMEIQKAYCDERGFKYMPTDPYSKVGFALQTKGKLPVNGLRHPSNGDTSGWYIWCGEIYSPDPEFFSPLHTIHLTEYCPQVLKFLGLPPGYRFLIAGEWEDVWFDEQLLSV